MKLPAHLLVQEFPPPILQCIEIGQSNTFIPVILVTMKWTHMGIEALHIINGSLHRTSAYSVVCNNTCIEAIGAN